MMIDIVKNGLPLGHEVRGVDLSKNIPDDVFDEIEQAYDQYGVIVFRNQKLSPEELIAFSERFGPLYRMKLEQFNLKSAPDIFVVSNIIENGEPIGMGDAGRYWHTDQWVSPKPPRGSILYAMEVPHDEAGKPLGDTCFASTANAYDTLRADLKERIEGLSAVYSRTKYGEYRAKISEDKSQQERFAKALKEHSNRTGENEQEIVHPLVRVHPRTGRKCLYLSEGAISHVIGLDQEESDKLIADLMAHVIRPEAVYRHSWTVGDVVMWDNWSGVHKAIADFTLPQRRLMYRTTLSSSSLDRNVA